MKTDQSLSDNLDSVPEELTAGYRGLLLIKRSKDGEKGNCQRKSIKRITENTEMWKSSVLELLELKKTVYPEHRIYSSANERNLTKAIQEFKRRQLHMDCGNVNDLKHFYCDIENRFFSCLMNPGSRSQNKFLIDCDTAEEYEIAKNQLDVSGLIILDYPTRNGRHIITKPFNPNEYLPMQIKKDDLIYIA